MYILFLVHLCISVHFALLGTVFQINLNYVQDFREILDWVQVHLLMLGWHPSCKYLKKFLQRFHVDVVL
jgi:hypothetical protein